jgi:hypothetical protein
VDECKPLATGWTAAEGALPLLYRFTAVVTAVAPGGWSGRVMLAEGTRNILEGVLLPEGNVTVEVTATDAFGSESSPVFRNGGMGVPTVVSPVNISGAGGAGHATAELALGAVAALGNGDVARALQLLTGMGLHLSTSQLNLSRF